jgi:uncharacterized membrane protein
MMTIVKIAAAAGFVALATFAAPAAIAADGGREVDRPGQKRCVAHLHRDYKGATMTAYAGRGWKFVGGSWNDKISSFSISSGCYVKAWQHRDYKGDSTTFSGSVRYTGDLWNDQISSWMCYCN